MQLDFAAFSHGRPGSGLPVARTRNLFIEASPLALTRRARIGRPGLVLVRTVGVGPVTATFRRAGVFDGDDFQISGAEVYRNASLLGAIPLGGFASIAASDTQIVFVQGGEAWCYDGSTYAQIAIPDSQAVGSVQFIGSRFYFTILADDVWYFSDIDDATTIDGLAFATADSAPDASLTAAIVGDQVAFIGRETVEFWSQTGDQDAPLVRSPGSKYDKGCAAAASVVSLDNRLFFVGYDAETAAHKVYVTGSSVPQKVSSSSVDVLLSESADIGDATAFPACADGHDFYVLNIPGKGTWAYQIDLGDSEHAWVEWSSWGLDGFRIRCGSGGLYGDSASGKVFTFDAATYTDDGEPIERLLTAVGPKGKYGLVELEAAMGVGPVDGTVPYAELHYSDDRGRSFTDWRAASLGAIGDYKNRTRWTRLGLARRERVIEVRSTANAPVVFAALRVNER